MALQFVLGSSGSGKSHYLFNKIIDDSIRHPDQNFLVIVPEQFTMQTQKQLVCMHPRQGIMNIDVLSFERLAYRVFDQVGASTRTMLEEIGKSFVLQKIALEKKKELPFMGSNLGRPGYIYEMKSLISELTQYDIHLPQLDEMIEKAEGKMQLQMKLKDVRTIYSAFTEYLQDRYMTAEEVLDVLGELADQSDLLKTSVVAFDGFTGFTPVQNKLLRRLFKLSPQVYVTATIDSRESLYEKSKDQELFFMSKKMIQTLSHMAAEIGVDIQPEIMVEGGEKSRFAQAPALAFLEQNLFRYQKKIWEDGQDEIVICAAKNPLTEVQMAAARIRRLVREEGYRYRDIVMLTGDLGMYGNYVRQVFSVTDIPYFIDEKKAVLSNPYVEFLRGLMAVEAEHYSYNSVFRYLRSGISDVTRDETNLLENHVLALGIRGYKNWSEKWVRHYRGQKPEELEQVNAIREKVMAELEPFHQALRGKEKPTVRQMTEALYGAGIARQVQKKLKEWESYFSQQDRPDLLREYGQIYGKIMSFLDKLVDVLGEDIVSFSDYQSILEAGFSETKIGIIPPSTDQVLLGDMQRTRLKDVKVLLFLGVNEGLIPKAVSEGGILSQSDREFLEAESIELKPSAREEVAGQRFYLYLNLTKPSKRLYLSYARTNSQGESCSPAYLIGSIRKLYPGLKIEEEAENLSELVEMPESSMEYLIQGLRLSAEKAMDGPWKELYRWYASHSEYAKKLGDLVEATHKSCPKDQIGKVVAQAMYGKTLENSATRLEKFAACAFAHFVQYGLQLSDRQQYEFTGMDLGNIVHTALESFSKKITDAKFDWSTMEDDTRDKLIDESINEVVHDYGNTILHSSARNEYMIERVRRIMKRTVWALQEQIRRSDFVPSRFEVSFQMEENLKSTHIDLSEDEKMKLKGRIDRVDTYEDEKNVYVKVIDYKSGSTSFDLVAIYHGLQLQLVLYMNAALELMSKEGKEVKPAGIFYYNVKDPVEEWAETDTEDNLKERILKDLKVNGLVHSDTKIIEHLDRKLADGGLESSIIPVKYNKNGSFSAASSVAGDEAFQSLSEFVQKRTVEIGKEILDGKVDRNPYERQNRSSCDYCPYHGICGFDAKIPGYEFRNLGNMKKNEVWKLMKEEEKADGSQLDQGTEAGH